METLLIIGACILIAGFFIREKNCSCSTKNKGYQPKKQLSQLNHKPPYKP
tara:strand:- start:1105 stop:1254 length:150 start_codon:yes stop_codon:yes gene_type:complete